MTGSASKAEKGQNFIKQTFPKKGVGKFSKKIHFWNQQGVSFRVVCFVCFEPSDPFQRTVHDTSLCELFRDNHTINSTINQLSLRMADKYCPSDAFCRCARPVTGAIRCAQLPAERCPAPALLTDHRPTTRHRTRRQAEPSQAEQQLGPSAAAITAGPGAVSVLRPVPTVTASRAGDRGGRSSPAAGHRAARRGRLTRLTHIQVATDRHAAAQTLTGMEPRWLYRWGFHGMITRSSLKAHDMSHTK